MNVSGNSPVKPVVRHTAVVLVAGKLDFVRISANDERHTHQELDDLYTVKSLCNELSI